MNMVDTDNLATAALPWPAGSGSGASNLIAVDAFRHAVRSAPAELLLAASENTGRDTYLATANYVADELGLGEVADLTGEHVRDYLDARIEMVVTQMVVVGVADRKVGILTADGPTDVYDAAILLGELFHTWPAPQPSAKVSALGRLVADVAAKIRPGLDLRGVEFTVDTGATGDDMVDGGIYVDYTDGDGDELSAEGIGTWHSTYLRVLAQIAGAPVAEIEVRDSSNGWRIVRAQPA
ncbi:MAG: hypothetical protein L0H59_13510 [Tomitella sp.]|nr:hypothetical protein [Tomitella sp.]